MDEISFLGKALTHILRHSDITIDIFVNYRFPKQFFRRHNDR